MAGYSEARAAFPIIRQSALAAFDSCELASFFDQTFGNYHTHPQGRGSIFHATVAECLRIMIENDRRTMADDVDLAYDILEEQLRQQKPGPDGRLPVPMDQIAELRITVKKWAIDNAFSIENIVGVEDRYNMTLQYQDPETGEVVDRVVSGQLDVLMIDPLDDAVVIDWKDTWALPGPSEISEGGFFQQRFYAMLVFAAYPAVQTVTLREFYPRYSEARTATIERVKLPDLIAEFSALVERFDATWQSHLEPPTPEEMPAELETIDADDTDRHPADAPAFNPSPGSHCSYCKMPERCPLLPDARGAGSVTNREQAEEAAGQILVSKAVVKKQTDALKNYVKEHGPVPIKDAKRPRVFGFVEVERTSRPTEDQLQAALMAADSEEERAAITASLYKKTKGTTFKDYVPEPVEETIDQ